MLTPEERRLLRCVRLRAASSLEDLARSCGASPSLVNRLLSQLEWSNYVIVYHDRDGRLTGVQITEMGLQCTSQWAHT